MVQIIINCIVKKVVLRSNKRSTTFFVCEYILRTSIIKMFFIIVNKKGEYMKNKGKSLKKLFKQMVIILTIVGTTKVIGKNITEDSFNTKIVKINECGITPFTVSVVGYKMDFRPYKSADKNIISTSIKKINTIINLNKTVGEPTKFEIDKIDFSKDISVLVKKNTVRSRMLELKLKDEKLITIDSNNATIHIEYPKEMYTYDEYEIIIYIRTSLNKGQRVDRYISDYVENKESKIIDIKNTADIEYQVIKEQKVDNYKYLYKVSDKSKVKIPYRYPTRIN